MLVFGPFEEALIGCALLRKCFLWPCLIWRGKKGGFDLYVLQVIGFERFFEVISASFASLAQGVLIKLARML